MKTLTSLTFLLIASSLIYSCKKDGRGPNEGTELLYQQNSDKSGVVWKRTYARNASDKLVSLRDSTNTGSFETISLEYGVDDRISRANYLGSGSSILFYYEFTYNADGTLKKKQAVPGTINLADDYDAYAYDANGRMIADSIYAKSGLPSTYKLSHVATFTYTGDNVTEALLYNYFTGAQVLQQKRKWEYDDSNNPFRNIALYYPIISTGSSIDLVPNVSKNNVVKEYAADDNDPYQVLQTWKYSYNSSNYPWKTKSGVEINGQGFVEIEYFYKQ